MSESVPVCIVPVKRPLCQQGPPPQCQSCLTAVVAVLTDAEHIYDIQVIHPDDLGQFNEIAQRETDGELWWEYRQCELEGSHV